MLPKLPPPQELAALPLSELAATVSGLSLDVLPDGRDFLQLVTFRVTAALAFGLPVDALGRDEALDVVHKVAAFFTGATAHLIELATTQQASNSLPPAKREQPNATATAAAAAAAAPAAASDPASTCFLSKLLADQAAGLLSQQAVQQLALEMLLAGTDTSSVSLYYLMVQLPDDPKLEQQLLAKVLQAVGSCRDKARQAKAPHALPATVNGSDVSDAFRPFGHGRKGCVGRELGWLEMKVMLACWMLTMRFRQSTCKPQPPADGAAAATAGVRRQVLSRLGVGSSSHNISSGTSAAGTPQPGLLEKMLTRWEVAAQPIQPLPLHVRCVQLAGGSRRRSGLRKLYVTQKQQLQQ
ncbi:cytochrome P450 [Scenedesmus sp. NREL 46B-D3]|nr:cytochrome P450 [Scenedesmus sp. NREL 46B-D3]